MTMHVLIAGDSDQKLWSLTGRERLERMIARQRGAVLAADPASLPADGQALILRGDHVFDPRLLGPLLAGGDALALVPQVGAAPVAIRTDAATAARLVPELTVAAEWRVPDGVPERLPTELVRGVERTLRKAEPPQVLPITEAAVPALEKELFGGAYKGVTDFITKWLWPLPAMLATRWCAARGITPNQVTLASLVLCVLAGAAFWFGFFGIGLLLGWIMTFLDTVDGKLARVTVTSSRFGDYLDHGIDLVHPPLWYVAWGMGLAAGWSSWLPLEALLWIMLGAYVGGRLCEGAFQLWVANFSIFIWEPVDSFSRLITARRNPNLLLLTGFWALGHPAAGLWAVVIWHLLSTGFLFWRVIKGLAARRSGAEVRPWLEEVDPVRDRHRLAVRVFTRAPAAAHGGAAKP